MGGRREDALAHQLCVRVQSHSRAELSGVEMTTEGVGYAVTVSATATLSDCSVSSLRGLLHQCVSVWNGGTAQLANSHFMGERDGSTCVHVRGHGSHVTARSCFLGNGEFGAVAEDDGKLIALGCESLDTDHAYAVNGGQMELLNCSSDDQYVGCCVDGGHLTATNVTLTNNISYGVSIASGNAQLRGCSVSGSKAEDEGCIGMQFNTNPQFGATEALVQDCTVEEFNNGGICALGRASVTVRGCRSRGNGTAGFRVGGDAHMTVAHSSSYGDTAGCVVNDDSMGN